MFARINTLDYFATIQKGFITLAANCIRFAFIKFVVDKNMSSA